MCSWMFGPSGSPARANAMPMERTSSSWPPPPSPPLPPPPPTDAGGLTTDGRGEQVGGISVLARHQGGGRGGVLLNLGTHLLELSHDIMTLGPTSQNHHSQLYHLGRCLTNAHVEHRFGELPPEDSLATVLWGTASRICGMHFGGRIVVVVVIVVVESTWLVVSLTSRNGNILVSITPSSLLPTPFFPFGPPPLDLEGAGRGSLERPRRPKMAPRGPPSAQDGF